METNEVEEGEKEKEEEKMIDELGPNIWTIIIVNL